MYDMIDMLCIVGGGYLIYAAVVMRVQGRIIQNVVLSKNIDENAIGDKEGFIRYLYWKLMLCGAIIILGSIVDLVNAHIGGPGVVSLVTCSIFAATIIGYGAAVNHALRKYVKK